LGANCASISDSLKTCEPAKPYVRYVQVKTTWQKPMILLLLSIFTMLSQPEAAQTQTAKPTHAHLQQAMFGAGCFWGVEETFRQIKGVKETAVGYSGGHSANPTYKEVCTDKTGHAEVVLVTYDPAEVSYAKLLNVFWDNHNPTTMNRQGPDVGTQYRSAIFYFNEEQHKEAEASKATAAASGRWGGRPVVTVVEAAKPFYKAEEYHQKYLAKRGLSNCHL